MEKLLALFLDLSRSMRHIWVAKKWCCLQTCALQTCGCKTIFFGLWLASDPSMVKDKWKHPCWGARGLNTLTANIDFRAANPSKKLGWAVHRHTDNHCFACFGLIGFVTVWIAHVSLRFQITQVPVSVFAEGRFKKLQRQCNMNWICFCGRAVPQGEKHYRRPLAQFDEPNFSAAVSSKRGRGKLRFVGQWLIPSQMNRLHSHLHICKIFTCF